MRRHSILILSLVFASGCASEGGYKLPGVYRVDVQQGNIIQQEMIDKLKPGMDKNQVRFIMGTPAVADPFHTDRWDYIYSMSEGGARREQRHLTLHFKDDKLTHITGDIDVVERQVDEMEGSSSSDSVDVPLKRKGGFFQRLFSALPFVDEDDPQREQTPASAQDAADGAMTTQDPVGSP